MAIKEKYNRWCLLRVMSSSLKHLFNPFRIAAVYTVFFYKQNDVVVWNVTECQLFRLHHLIIYLLILRPSIPICPTREEYHSIVKGSIEKLLSDTHTFKSSSNVCAVKYFQWMCFVKIFIYLITFQS